MHEPSRQGGAALGFSPSSSQTLRNAESETNHHVQLIPARYMFINDELHLLDCAHIFESSLGQGFFKIYLDS